MPIPDQRPTDDNRHFARHHGDAIDADVVGRAVCRVAPAIEADGRLAWSPWVWGPKVRSSSTPVSRRRLESVRAETACCSYSCTSARRTRPFIDTRDRSHHPNDLVSMSVVSLCSNVNTGRRETNGRLEIWPSIFPAHSRRRAERSLVSVASRPWSPCLRSDSGLSHGRQASTPAHRRREKWSTSPKYVHSPATIPGKRGESSAECDSGPRELDDAWLGAPAAPPADHRVGRPQMSCHGVSHGIRADPRVLAVTEE